MTDLTHLARPAGTRVPALGFWASALAGFVVTSAAGAAVALAYGPFLRSSFGDHIRTTQEGLAVPALTSGYAVVAVVMAWLTPRVATGRTGWRHGAVVGTAIGLTTFLGDHLVTAGWSRIATAPMLASGVVDVLSGIAGGIAIALVQQRAAKSG